MKLDTETRSRYESYVYAYPHKTAYRRIEPALPLGPLWAGERRDALFLYLHVPFCEQRCGFCNLFTQPVPEGSRVEAYLATLARQVTMVRRALDEGGPFAIARAAHHRRLALERAQVRPGAIGLRHRLREQVAEPAALLAERHVDVEEQRVAALAGPQRAERDRRLDPAVRRLVRVRVEVGLVRAAVERRSIAFAHSSTSA